MIKYPSNISSNNKEETSSLSYKNRGLSLESMINDTNKFYVFHDKALIYKKPTPIHIVKIDNKEKVIKEAFFEMPSTTDYNGIYKGKYIDFEAKETKSKTSFTLSNIHPHQIKHLKKVKEMGGIAFLIIYFTLLDKAFLYFIDDYENYFNKENNKKSIPLEELIKNGHEIKISLFPPLDYLKIIDELFF